MYSLRFSIYITVSVIYPPSSHNLPPNPAILCDISCIRLQKVIYNLLQSCDVTVYGFLCPISVSAIYCSPKSHDFALITKFWQEKSLHNHAFLHRCLSHKRPVNLIIIITWYLSWLFFLKYFTCLHASSHYWYVVTSPRKYIPFDGSENLVVATSSFTALLGFLISYRKGTIKKETRMVHSVYSKSPLGRDKKLQRSETQNAQGSPFTLSTLLRVLPWAKFQTSLFIGGGSSESSPVSKFSERRTLSKCSEDPPSHRNSTLSFLTTFHPSLILSHTWTSVYITVVS